MAETKLFLVTKEDTIVQVSTYLVRAYDEEMARSFVDSGMFIEESAPTTLETLESHTRSVEEITPEGNGQQR